MRTTTWVTRWNGNIMASEPELPGVWRLKDGGFWIRGRARDGRTGKLREVNRALPECRKAREAGAILEAELARIRDGAAFATARTMPTFAEWAVTVFERKVKSGAIVSASGRKKWDWCLRVHLIPAFGDVFIDKLTREDVERWMERELLAVRTKTKDEKRERELEGGRYKPQTINSLLDMLGQIMGEASDTFNIADPCRKVEHVSKRTHRTYTYEEPNSLRPEDVARFLAEFRVKFPEYYAFVFLGITTGLRPSSLRPLRWRGPNADVKWDDSKLLVRRSHTEGQEAMDSTKTGVDLVLELDPEQLSVLRWHVDRLQRENERRAKRSPKIAAVHAESELLFPAAPTRWNAGGGFQSRGCLAEPFRIVGKAIGLTYEISPRAMRRTFQDLARAAKVNDIVTRSISGHATETMQRHYSTVAPAEQREGVAKVIDIATGRERAA